MRPKDASSGPANEAHAQGIQQIVVAGQPSVMEVHNVIVPPAARPRPAAKKRATAKRAAPKKKSKARRRTGKKR